MEFIDLTSASEDERFEVKGILSNVSRNLEFTCGNKLINNNNNNLNNNSSNNNSCNNSNSNNINNCNNINSNTSNNKEYNIKENHNKDKPQNGNQLENYSKSNQPTPQFDNVQNNFKNGNNIHNNYYYNVHQSVESENQQNNHLYHHINNHHQNHYNNHPNSQQHSNHYHNIHHNNHPNNRMQVLPAYSTFIPGPVSNGSLPPDSAHYKMSFFPQFASSAKHFYPNSGPTGPHFSNVLTSISSMAATIATAPTMANNVVTSNHLTEVITELNGNAVRTNNNPNNENGNIVPSYPVTAYPRGPTPANSFVHAQYIPAHPSAHFSTHPMIYLPIHMPQFYPHHYPTHMATPQPIIASHQPLATPPVSPPQCKESNANNNNNSEVNNHNSNLNTNLIYVEENKLVKNGENKKSQSKIVSNYNFLSPESLKEETEFENEFKNDNKNKNESKNENKKQNEKQDKIDNKERNRNNSEELKLNYDITRNQNQIEKLNEENKDNVNQNGLKENNNKKYEEIKDNNQNVSSFSSSEFTIATENEDELDQTKSISLSNSSKDESNFEKEISEDESKNRAKSWADLFKSNKTSNAKLSTVLNGLTNSPLNKNLSENLFTNEDFEPLGQNIGPVKKFSLTNQIKSAPLDKDEIALKLARKLKDTNLKHSLPFLTPRGFVNKSNMCYINSILQALLYCPPFYNLMREIGEFPILNRDKSATPIIDSFAKFFSNFMPNEQLMRRVKSGLSFNIDDLPKLETYEPRCIYNVLGNINNECLKGKQEDAEEFLASVLNGLHEEMVLLFNYDNKINSIKNVGNGLDNLTVSDEELSICLSEEDKKNNAKDDKKLVWKEVKTKHKTLSTNESKVKETPITDIFGGTMLFVRVAGKDVLYIRQPFFSLKLDIQSDKIRTIEDALRNFTSNEFIHGYTCPKTNKTIDASCQIFLDQLPIILILHLKLNYEKDGIVKKLMKKIDYSIDLEMPKECLSHQERSKYSKTYKLLAVVHHDGKETEKGHFLTDIYHIGTSLWLRCNDNNIESISTQQLLNTQSPRIPYLLFYRRCDTLRGSNKNHIS